MKILISGNLGYIGPLVTRRLRSNYPNAKIFGFDTEYFKHILPLSNPAQYSQSIYRQYYGDVRKFNNHFLEGINHIVYLAAISDDPMGKEFENVTKSINCDSATQIAKQAKSHGVSSFVYASSCSIYGFAENVLRTETSETNPLTAYAKSKLETEKILAPIADSAFTVTCLRFATACGFSPRLRLDLVLNDFVANALSTGEIHILSNGKPWRPLIHVEDMARAIDWAIFRTGNNGGTFLSVNTGSNDWNYQVKELADGIKRIITDVEIKINKSAKFDKRSYKVDFSLFNSLATKYKPKMNLEDAIKDLISGLRSINFNDQNFRSSKFIRLNVLREHINNGRLNKDLFWTQPQN